MSTKATTTEALLAVITTAVLGVLTTLATAIPYKAQITVSA